MRLVLPLLALAALAAGCTPTQTVRVDATGPVPEVDAPRFVGAGDRVRVVVSDSVWGNRYLAAEKVEDLAVIDRALVFGGGSGSALSKVVSFFEPVLRRTADPGTEADPEDPVGALAPPPVDTSYVAAMPPADADPQRRGALLQALARLTVAAAALRVTTDSANSALDTLRQWVGARPAALQTLSFLASRPAHALARGLATDPTGAEAERLLLEAAGGGARLQREELHRLVSEARGFARRVDALRAALPADLPEEVVEGLRTRVDELRRLRAAAGSAAQLRRDAHAELQKVARGFTPPVTVLPLEPAPALDDPVVFQLDLADLLADGRVRTEVRDDLVAIRRNAERLAAALAQLPAWTVGPGEEVAMDRTFPGGKEVTIRVVRQPRFGVFTLTPAAAQGGTGGGGGTGSGGAGGGGTAAAPGLRESQTDSLARIRLEVVPRHRFHVTAGLVYSRQHLRTFETTPDSTAAGRGVYLRQTAESPSRLFPVGLLSYTVYPFGGKIYAAQEYAGPPTLARFGISLQAGLSLLKPTEDLFFGLSTEPVPGIELGAGYHLAYTETNRFPVGDFVPDRDGPATEKRWRGKLGAVSLSVDAKVFFETLGALLK